MANLMQGTREVEDIYTEFMQEENFEKILDNLKDKYENNLQDRIAKEEKYWRQ